jgi:hypothetical protein
MCHPLPGGARDIANNRIMKGWVGEEALLK